MKQTIPVLCLLLFATAAIAQTSPNKLSLEQSIAFALENNPGLKNKKLDVEYARGQVLETTSIGLPQVNGSVQFNQNIELPVFVFPNPQTGEQMPIRVGQTFSTTAGISITQLIFDGQYLLGLKAAQQFVEMSSSLEKMNSAQLKNTVTKSYLLCLITAENLKLVQSNLSVIEKTYEQTAALQKAGFAEKLDVDRLMITKSNLETQIKTLENQVLLTEKLLKMNLGMEVNLPIELTDKIEVLYNLGNDLLLVEENSYTQRPEYAALTTQQGLNNLNLKRYKVSMVPSLSAFYNYQQAFYGDELTFDPWFSTSLWGLQMRIPIFKGMNTKAQLQKVNVEISKTENDLANFKQGAQLEVFQHQTKYKTNLENMNIQKQNMKLAEDVLSLTTKKFENGMGSNIEVISAQNDLKTAQTNYLNALYEVAISKTDLLKALGKN